MKHLYKLIIRIAIICFVVSLLFSRAHAESLIVYAGPQSVSPQEIIYVTIETAALEADVELSYIADGHRKTLTGITTHGLISFDVPAQTQTGHMSFTAKARHTESNTALVIVLSGAAETFKMTAKQSDQTGFVDISSDMVTDKYDNIISNLSLVSIDWSDANGLLARHSTQLSQGKIALTTQCPSKFIAPLRLTASINAVSTASPDLSELCRAEKR